MGVLRSAAAVLGLCLACAASAQGGLYSSLESFDGALSPDFRKFRNTLIPLLQIGLRDAQGKPVSKDKLNSRYLLVEKQLAQGIPANLTVEERLNLGAALLRLRKPEDAIQVMKPAELQDRSNFLILANLATAYHMSGVDNQAFVAADSAVALWPTQWSKLSKERRLALGLQLGWDEAQFTWYRKAERYFRNLLQLRMREAQQQGKGAQPSDGPDDLFRVRFVGDSGQYEPGKIAAAELAKLPKDALLIVQQLLVWLPNDQRLYWLLGELYNAQGDTDTALTIFNDIVNKSGGSPQLRQHRSVLQAHPRTAAASDGGGSSRPPPGENDTSDAPAALDPWQTLAVGFVAGLLVALLADWQVRELWRRRRQRMLVPKS
jgi:tetratricopeptide (TPR) repeat protein